MASWGGAILSVLVLLALPCAAAYDITTLSPGRVRPQDVAASLAWSAASGALCDDADAQADVAVVNRETALDGADTAPVCAAVGPHAGALLVAGGIAPPAAASTAGAAASDPVDGATFARAEVAAAGLEFHGGFGEADRYHGAPLYPPAVSDGAREPAPLAMRSGEGAPGMVALPWGAPFDEGEGDGAGASSSGSRAPASARVPPDVGRADGSPRVQAAIVVAGSVALAIAAALLYQRIGAHDALLHPGRAALFAAVKARADGAQVGALAEAAGMTRKTAEYHLLYLRRAGFVEAHGEPRVWTLAGARAPVGPDERLAALVRGHPGVSTARLAELAGMTRSRVDRHAKALVLRGAITARAVDGERCFFAP